MKFLSLLLLLVSLSAFAKNSYHWQKSAEFKSIVSLYSEKNQEALKKISENKSIRVRDISNNFNIDMTIFDLVDQFTIKSNKKKYNFLKQEILNLKPNILKNFGPFFKSLISRAESNKDIDHLLKTLIFQSYNTLDHGLPVTHKILYQGRFKRIFYQRSVYKFNLLASDPEGQNLLKIGKEELSKISKYTFITPKLTTTASREFSKNTINKIIKKHYSMLHEELSKELKREQELLDLNSDSYKLKLKLIANDKIHFRPEAKQKESNFKEIYRQAILLTNQLYQSPFKRLYLENIAFDIGLDQLKEAEDDRDLGFTIINSGNLNTILLTPHFVAKNLRVIKDSVRHTSFKQIIDREADWALMALKKFIKEYRESIEHNLKIKVPEKITIAYALEIYPKLKLTYPSYPWMNGAEIYSKSGFPIDIDISKYDRFLEGADFLRKRIFNLENVAGLVAGTGTLMLTGNPFASATSSVLVRDIIYAKRYGKNIGKYLLEETPAHLGTAMLTATGFAGGKLMHAFYVGAVGGLKQSISTGRPIEAGMIVGAITSAINAYLPPALSNPVIKGMNKDFQNALLEYVYEAADHGVDGFFVSLFTDGNYEKGIITGAIYGVAETTQNIYFRGFKYDPSEFVTQEDIDNYLNGNQGYSHSYFGVSHNDLLIDRAYNGEKLTLSMDDFRRTVFRKNSPWRKSFKPGSENYYRSNYNSSVSNVSMGIGRESNKTTLIHEAVHHRQYQTVGYQVFKLKRLLINDKLFEDYVSVEDCGCLDNWFPFK